MKKAALTLILICLMASGAVCVLTVKAQPYQGSITINADGSISPSTAPIQQTDNIYTLTSDVDGDIAVNASNIVLDGKGYTLLGGVTLTNVSNVTVKGFIITNTAMALQAPMIGIALTNVTNAIVANNTITGIESILAWNGGTYAGIYVKGGNSNTITGNSLLNNLNGLDFLNTSNNTIFGNNIVGQQIFLSLYTTGIWFINSPNNKIYHNNFINSTYLVQVSGSINTWDDGYLGNYWSNYKAKYPSAVQIGDSGVYNIPYSIDAQNTDPHPLTQPFSSEFYAPKIPLKISVLSPVNQEFNESSVPLAFTVNKLSAWMGYSLDGRDNITVAGNTTLSGLSNGLHNVTIYANDTFGNMGASEAVTFRVDVAEPFPTALVATASGASAAVACLGLLVYFKKRKRLREK